MDHVHRGKSDWESNCLCSTDVSPASNVKERIKGRRNRETQVDSERPTRGHSNIDVEHRNGNVHGKLQSAEVSFEPSSEQMHWKDLHAVSRADEQRQPEVSDALVRAQQGSGADEKGRKPQYEKTEFQNIWSLGKGYLWCGVCEVTLKNLLSVQQHVLGKQHEKKLAVAAVDIERLWGTIGELEGGRTEDIYVISRNKFWCKLCSDIIGPTDIVAHVERNTHQQKSKELKETGKKYTGTSQKWVKHNMHDIWGEICRAENGKWSNIWHSSGETFHCEPCKVILSVGDVLSHVSDAPHQEKMRTPENVQTNEYLMKIARSLWQETQEMDRTHEKYFKIDNSTTVYCTSCCVRVPAAVQNVTDHIRGKAHMTSIIGYLTSQCPSVKKQAHSSAEEDLPSPKVTQTQNMAEGTLNVREESVTSEGTQPETCETSCNAQDTLLKALLPKVKDSSLLRRESSLFQCTLCDTEIESEAMWNLHKHNQKHRIEVRKQVAEGGNPVACVCSLCGAMIFCNQSEFVKHACRREVPSDGVAENAEQLQRSDTAAPLHEDKLAHEQPACGTSEVPRIVVSGYPRGVGMDLLYTFFKDFGTVCFVAVTSETAVIEFVEWDAVKRALERPLSLANAALTVTTLTCFNHTSTVAELVHESVVSALASIHSLQETVAALCTTADSMCSTNKDQQVCQFLETVFSADFPGCKAIPFGSRVSGLALSGSDLDVFLDTGGMYSGRYRQGSDIQKIIISAAESTLSRDPDCCDVEGVPSARTPIVKFFHKPSGTRCDIAFRHGLGCENTQLIKFYLSLDPRVRHVVLFIKHWAHLHKLSGPSSITSYALDWLVIFCLQNASGFGLPSVELLQRRHEGPMKRIGGWKCSFNRNKFKIPVIKSSQTVLQLVHGFFTYYNNFNFSEEVICPLVGHPIDKYLFSKSPQHLPRSMEAYVHQVTKDKHAERFRVKCHMCVQDPFDLSHNLTKGTSAVILQKFKILCGLSGDICAKIGS